MALTTQTNTSAACANGVLTNEACMNFVDWVPHCKANTDTRQSQPSAQDLGYNRGL